MKTGRKAALTACSDPLPGSGKEIVEEVAQYLAEKGLIVERSPYLFGCDESDPGRKKAEVLNSFFKDPEMEFIFDVTGGDLANTVLRYLDFEAVRESRAVFHGFSDLTTVINAIASRTGREAVNYQIRNIAGGTGANGTAPAGTAPAGTAGQTGIRAVSLEERRQYFDRAVLRHEISPEDLEARFVRGGSMRGRVVGGNVRCMLKLAGTKYWPDLRGAILLLEAHGGGVNQMTTMVEQYLELGAAEQINGVLLGTFSRMEEKGMRPGMPEIVLRMFPENIPVAQTRFVGHGKDARAIVIGREITLNDQERSQRGCVYS